MGEEPVSFGRLVFGRAVSDTARFLGYRTRDLILGGVALVLGVICAYIFVGNADTVKEVALMVAFTFAPGGIILFAVFLWHLWLAPAVLAYEAATDAQKQTLAVILAKPREASAPPSVPKARQVNWAVWKQRAKYTLYEFGAILAKDNPSDGTVTNDASAFVSLLIESVKDNKLRAAKIEWDLAGEVGGLTEISKSDGLAWSKQREFSTDHIE